ncbi:selenide,water dikinase [Anaerosolibacter carboniphilus]|uniref:Selenide, water dikinase n=1 Tax=Anaerosolibacter carboniphilus TaxID=1417629 RepID=A0A841KS29_9FIRM|nr:selenide,water dikinase [Anaerosolibacter carboniphilus]
MAQVLCHLPKIHDPKLLVGLETSDDAAVYKLDDETALVQTLDFFTPIVDDPYMYGQIAAANSLSDVYAMGGQPLLAMNIACFPNCFSQEVLTEILKGGAEKIREAGALLVGGHTVEDNEPKYGLSVTGIVHPDKVISNAMAKPGDQLILTKPLGMGILNTALKADLLSKSQIEKVMMIMATLNNVAADGMKKFGASACTDITGFGLLGHAYEMAKASKVSMKIDHRIIPTIDNAVEYGKMGLVPAGAYANRKYVAEHVRFDDKVPQHMQDILFDPQTSGGLLISLPKDQVDSLLNYYRRHLSVDFAVIGEVMEKDEASIYVL